LLFKKGSLSQLSEFENGSNFSNFVTKSIKGVLLMTFIESALFFLINIQNNL